MRTIFFAVIVVLSIVACNSPKQQTMSVTELNSTDFQTTISEKKTNLYFLKNGVLSAVVTNYGGRIVKLIVPDKEGNSADIILGFNSIEGYLEAKEVFHGAIIGRVGNRIAKGKFTLGGTDYTLPRNNGANHLHGGSKGFHNVVWEVNTVTDSSIVLTYLSPGGKMGYPGNLNYGACVKPSVYYSEFENCIFTDARMHMQNVFNVLKADNCLFRSSTLVEDQVCGIETYDWSWADIRNSTFIGNKQPYSISNGTTNCIFWNCTGGGNYANSQVDPQFDADYTATAPDLIGKGYVHI